MKIIRKKVKRKFHSFHPKKKKKIHSFILKGLSPVIMTPNSNAKITCALNYRDDAICISIVMICLMNSVVIVSNIIYE